MLCSNYLKEVIRMSKTYNKFVCFSDYHKHYTKWAKRQASKLVRKTFDIDSGSSYKKMYPEWSIHDFKSTFYSRFDVEDNRLLGLFWKEPLYTDEEKAKFFPYWYKNNYRA